MPSYITAIIIIGFSSAIFAQGGSQAVDRLEVIAPSGTTKAVTAKPGETALGSKSVKLNPNTFIWTQWHQFDLSQHVSKGSGSSYKANTTVNYYRLGIGHWFMPKLMMGFSTAYFTAFSNSSLNSLVLLSEFAPPEYQASFKASSQIKGLNVQPFASYLLSRVFFIDATGGFSSVEYKFRQLGAYKQGIDQLTNTSSSSTEGYNWNFSTGINAVFFLSRVLFNTRVGYLFVQTNRNSFIVPFSRGDSQVAKGLTTYAHSVTFALFAKWLISKTVQPFAGFTYLYNFSRSPDAITPTARGVIYLSPLNLITGRSQYFYRAGINIVPSKNFTFHFMYTRIDRGNQTGDAYLLRASVHV